MGLEKKSTNDKKIDWIIFASLEEVSSKNWFFIDEEWSISKWIDEQKWLHISWTSFYISQKLIDKVKVLSWGVAGYISTVFKKCKEDNSLYMWDNKVIDSIIEIWELKLQKDLIKYKLELSNKLQNNKK